jgi:hypothetical protein
VLGKDNRDRVNVSMFLFLSDILNFLQIAAEMFREHAKQLVQENISSALDILKSRIPYGTYLPFEKHATRFNY